MIKKIFALIVAATMGLSSAAFAADTTTAPAQTAQAAKKPVKKHKKAAAPQTAQAAKKHVKKHTKAAAATPAA